MDDAEIFGGAFSYRGQNIRAVMADIAMVFNVKSPRFLQGLSDFFHFFPFDSPVIF
jgi:hypothetical protein